MVASKNNALSLAIFCKVVDNYGDIGICWRLARQLESEHGVSVTLWVDDLSSFKRICHDVAPDVEVQQIAGVVVRHWRDQEGVFAADDIADIVIEFFACDIPPGYIAAMAQCSPRPLWFNLEGLSAETWVEGCHTLPSPHPRLPLTKHFFFPGFTDKTGGLLREANLDAQRSQFQSNPTLVADFLSRLGVPIAQQAATKVSLFCYPEAPVRELFHVWQSETSEITCLVPEGVAARAVEEFLDRGAQAGAARTRGALTVHVLPFVSQQDYDRLLWACDLNFVRGEDSFVRAQWAARPFVWHIYPQDKNLHHVKLRAFLQRYAARVESLVEFSLAWNGVLLDTAESVDWQGRWQRLRSDFPGIVDGSEAWQRQMHDMGDLASNLLKFADSLRSAREEKKV